MGDIQHSILELFKKEPNMNISTHEIISRLFSSDYASIEKKLKSTDREEKAKAKKQKAGLHRMILYHLNKLVDDNILKVTSIQGKGEKVFSLNIDEGEYVIEKNRKRVFIKKTSLPSMPMEKYESQNILLRFGGDSWISKLNAVLIECENFESLSLLYSAMQETISNINDAIAFNNFEYFIFNNPEEKITDFIKRIAIDAEDYGRCINIIINFNNIHDKNKVLAFLDIFSRFRSDNLEVIFNIDDKSLHSYSDFFEKTIELFHEKNIKLNINNTGISPSPCFFGQTGVYVFDREEWEKYAQEKDDSLIGLACAQCIVAADVYRFFQKYKTNNEFRDFIMSIARSLVSANTIQRRKFIEFFGDINKLNKSNIRGFYQYNRNYIRFWNYDWKEQKELMIDLIKSCKEKINEFCYDEEAVFKSCGIPIRFRIAFSSIFNNYGDEFLSKRTYAKTTLHNINDFQKPEFNDFIKTREKILNVFDGGDRIRFFRAGNIYPKEIIHELSFILKSYNIPFFCYDFSKRESNLTLKNFIK
ncbi:hypothetical protein JW949_04310 [Candidatus Woesearchaeota archaeon]|nr:hypothetical protein [Candidatus Woesearchaeota archaeon]